MPEFVVIPILVVGVIVILALAFSARYKTVSPDEAMIVTGGARSSRRTSPRDHGRADRRGGLPQPRHVRAARAGGRRDGPEEDGTRDCRLHDQGRARPARLPRSSRSPAHCGGEA